MGEPIRWIFANGWWRRWRAAACRATGRRSSLAWGSARPSAGWSGCADRQRCAGQDGRAQAQGDLGRAPQWLLARIRERDFTLRGLVAELAERGLKVDYRSVWTFVHAEKLSFKKKRAGQRTGSS